jgi:osmotically-inducible protein OsmY
MSKAGSARMKKPALLRHKLSKLIATPVALGLVIIATGCAGNRYDRSTGESIDDRATTTRVKGALSDDTMFKYPDVKVTTFKGTVQLSGFVDNRDQKSKATEIAKTIPGVREVENNITVKP